jgi:hypothetical protein
MARPVKVLGHPRHEVPGGKLRQKPEILALNHLIHVPAQKGHNQIARGLHEHIMQDVTEAEAEKLNQKHRGQKGDKRPGIFGSYHFINKPLVKHGIDNNHCRCDR